MQRCFRQCKWLLMSVKKSVNNRVSMQKYSDFLIDTDILYMYPLTARKNHTLKFIFIIWLATFENVCLYWKYIYSP